MPEPPDDFSGEPDNFSPNYGGLLFYTLFPDLAIPAGGTLGGFAFQADDIFRYVDDAMWTGVSNTPSAFLDASYSGMISEFGYTGGPTLVPEPATIALVLLLPIGWMMQRRRMDIPLD
jgi:hypothetical protein